MLKRREFFSLNLGRGAPPPPAKVWQQARILMNDGMIRHVNICLHSWAVPSRRLTRSRPLKLSSVFFYTEGALAQFMFLMPWFMVTNGWMKNWSVTHQRHRRIRRTSSEPRQLLWYGRYLCMLWPVGLLIEEWCVARSLHCTVGTVLYRTDSCIKNWFFRANANANASQISKTVNTCFNAGVKPAKPGRPVTRMTSEWWPDQYSRVSARHDPLTNSLFNRPRFQQR